jgi:Leucine rich repeat
MLTCEDKVNECEVYDGTPNFDVRDDTQLTTCVRLKINDTNVSGIQDAVVQMFWESEKIIAVGLNFTTIFEEDAANQTWPNLKVVCMSSNRVERLQSNSFLQAQNVSLIDLSENQIADIDMHAFADLGDLKILYLNQNQIENLDFLVVLSSVEVLDLSENLITNVSEGTFMTNQELDVLKLQSNRILMVDLKAFQPLKQISSLDLSFNPLAMLHAKTFCGLRNLTNLNLANTSLPENEFYPEAKNFSQVEMLNLTMPCQPVKTAPHQSTASPKTTKVSNVPYKKVPSGKRWYDSNWVPVLLVLVWVGGILAFFNVFCRKEIYEIK